MSTFADDGADARLVALAWVAVERYILPQMLEIHEAALREALGELRGQTLYLPKGCDEKRRRRNDAMVADYRGGMPVDQIAARYHVSPATSARILKGGA